MSVDRPPKSLVWKDRPKSRKVSKIRTVSTIHRTTRLEPLTEDTTSDTAPQPNVGDAEGTVSEEPAPSEPPSEPTSKPPIQVEAVQPPVPTRMKAKMVWPPRAGAPGFEMHRGRMYYSETEEQDKHDDPPLPATTSSTRRSFPLFKYEDCHSEPEPTIDSKLPGNVKDDKSPEGIKEQHGIGETEFDRKKRHIEMKAFLSELPSGPIGYSGRFGFRLDEGSEGCFDFGPDTSSSGPNPEQPRTENMSTKSETHIDFRPDTSSETKGIRSSVLTSSKTSKTL